MKYFLLDTRNKNKCILSTEDPEEAANAFYDNNCDLNFYGDIQLFSLNFEDREIRKIDSDKVYEIYP